MIHLRKLLKVPGKFYQDVQKLYFFSDFNETYVYLVERGCERSKVKIAVTKYIFSKDRNIDELDHSSSGIRVL